MDTQSIINSLSIVCHAMKSENQRTNGAAHSQAWIDNIDSIITGLFAKRDMEARLMRLEKSGAFTKSLSITK